MEAACSGVGAGSTPFAFVRDACVSLRLVSLRLHLQRQPRRLQPQPLRPPRVAQPASPLRPRLSGLPSPRRSADWPRLLMEP